MVDSCLLDQNESLVEPVAVFTGGLSVGRAHERFMDGLTSFERSLCEQDFAKAAFVASELSNLAKAFDLRVRFPDLFSRYYHLFSLHIDKIASLWEFKDFSFWQVAMELSAKK
ncbi:hypothetical protein JYU14_04250 [Simkania negevensis]|uniref:Uncharacterized protein n=1 Tax=Simkania negevensis TaxID=83561 RepID=A0ABS3ASG2_9BACT|nr:hypothetical protein [Simkania negevensis]